MCKPLPINSHGTWYHVDDVEIRCSCSRYILEVDTLFCDVCGDVCCDRCRKQCFHCGQFICENCANSDYECIKCSQNKGNFVNEVFIFLDGGIKRKVKNGGYFMTIIEEAKAHGEKVTLKIGDKKYLLEVATYHEKLSKRGIYDYIVWMNGVV